MNQTEPKLFYKYYPPKEYVVNALTDETVCFTDLYSQNDPFESFGFYQQTCDYNTNPENNMTSLENEFWKNTDEYMTENDREMLTNLCRIFCTTSKNDNLLMWAHYAQSHQGICVGYMQKDIQNICTTFEHVTYTDHPQSVEYSSELRIDLLLKKAIDWKYEDEYRGIYVVESSDCNHYKTISKYINHFSKYSLQGTTQGRYLTGGIPPVRFSM